MNKNSWLVIADSSLARIYRIENTDSLVELIVLQHPESRLHNLDIVSDKPGRDFERVGVTRHAVGHMNTPKKHEFALFAKEIANYLREAHNKHEFEHLYLAASPQFLGLLRDELDQEVQKKIRREIDRDFTQLTISEILNHLHLHHVT